jgi:hypothetical protein
LVSWDRCYDFKNIFAKKFCEKIGPNLTEGPAATWDLRRSIKEEEEEAKKWRFWLNTKQNFEKS